MFSAAGNKMPNKMQLHECSEAYVHLICNADLFFIFKKHFYVHQTFTK